MPTLFFDLVQGSAVMLDMAGAVLVTGRSRRIRRAEFGSWIVGDLLWVVTGFVTENRYLMLMFAFYWVMAVAEFFNVLRD